MEEHKVAEDATSLLGIAITSYHEKYLEKKTVTFYNIECESHITERKWTLEKRYSDFKTMRDNMLKLIPSMPDFPGTTFFKVSSAEALNKRKDELQKFLRECVLRKEILLQVEFRDFLDLNANAPEIIGNDVTLSYDYKKLPMGCRSFIVVPHKQIMCVCCSDMNIISRADSMLTNLHMPWEKKTDKHVPLGCAFIYQCKPDPKETYIIHKAWAASYPIQTGVIFWEDTKEIYCVGNDDGKVHVYKMKPKSYFTQADKVGELPIHTNRVMGLALDPRNMMLYSCSTDRNFYVTDLNEGKGLPSTLINVSIMGYTNLEYDQKNNRIFLTNEAGELSVYSLESGAPECVRNLQTSSLSCIRAFHVDYMNCNIFTGSVNGKICIMNLGLPGKERLISEISNFGVTMKIRVCTYHPGNHELITGDEEGRVTIWGLKTGKPIYMWGAHPGSAITQIWYEKEFNILWTGGKDKHIRMWKLPDKWVGSEVSQFEENTVSKITAKIAEKKIEKLNELDQDDSDNDDLNGWNFRPY